MNQDEINQYNKQQAEIYAKRTGFMVDIQNIGRNTRTIALREKPSREEVHPNVWLNKEVLELEDGNFSNVYNLYWKANDPTLATTIHSAKHPYYLLDYIESDPSILAVINGSFFFLIDVVDKEPKDYPFHFCVRNGKVVGLLSSDEPIIYTIKSKLFAKEAKAKGVIKIGEHTFEWVGSKTKDAQTTKNPILYNSGSSKLIKVFDPKTGVRMGTLDNNQIHTPSKPDVVDLVIDHDTEGNLFVSNIVIGGNSHYFDGLFIIQILASENKFNINDKVVPLSMDGLDLQTIDSAITVGKSVKDEYFFVPERINSRDARSLIAQDVNGDTHYIVFDGSKYIPKFKGVSAKDLANYFAPDKYNWAYFLDGGSSSRIIIRDGKDFRFLANDFAFKKVTNEVFLWDWKRHRKLASTIALQTKSV